MGGLSKFYGKFDLYTLTFERKGDYLYVFVGEGEDSLEVSIDFWRIILSQCNSQGCSKILVEEDLEGSLTSGETFQLCSEIGKMGYEDLLVAFVDRHPDHLDMNRFGEMLVTKKGLKIHVFNSVAEAEQWLSTAPA